MNSCFSCFSSVVFSWVRLCSLSLLTLFFASADAQVTEKSSDSLSKKNIILAIDKFQKDILIAAKLKIDVAKTDTSRIINELTASLITGIDSLQRFTESELQLQSLHSLLNTLLYSVNKGSIAPQKIAALLNLYNSVIQHIANKKKLLPLITQSEVPLGILVLKSFQKMNAVALYESRNYLVIKTYEENPSDFFKVLYVFADVKSADSLLILAARKLPEDLYNYSQAKNSELGKRIAGSNDSLVKLIYNISASMQGPLYLPFLDDLYRKKISFTDINKTLGDGNQTSYYKLLVKTVSAYQLRLNQKDTVIAMQSALNRLEYSALHHFIYVVNELHESADKIRFKVLENLNGRDLYYLCITGVNDLYTSSYLKIYQLIFDKRFSQSSYDLLKSVHFDHFKRFIKMASTFNTLDDFLNRMQKKEADSLLHAFVDDLDKTGAIEDAVDVADSYASIRNESLRKFILNDIEKKISGINNNVDSTLRIYKLLHTIFLSLDTASHIDLSKTLGIPSVYRIENNFLKDKLGQINIQQFFYGDKDGRHAYDVFTKSFRNANWKVKDSKYWVEFVSVKGTPVHIYCNKPLDDDTNEAEKAQQYLSIYLRENNKVPSFFIHRGHSYYLNNSMQYLSASNKIIFLGSCGGYTQLNKVFTQSPLAHIITTKQEGSAKINQPMIACLCELLRSGKNLDWPGLWKVLKVRFKNDPRFDDYVPPHQNLGAILMIAVNRLKNDK